MTPQPEQKNAVDPQRQLELRVRLRAYMAYSRSLGSGEGALLVFAHNAKEAKKISFPTVSYFSGGDWLDMAVNLLNNDDLFKQADQEKLANGIPHVIYQPVCCIDCNQWGGKMEETGRCVECEETYYTSPQPNTD